VAGTTVPQISGESLTDGATASDAEEQIKSVPIADIGTLSACEL
jgi:hypothetical protein